MSDRLRALNWADDSAAFDHAHSRALPMREYLHRADLWWAKTYDAEVTTPPDIADELKLVAAALDS